MAKNLTTEFQFEPLVDSLSSSLLLTTSDRFISLLALSDVWMEVRLKLLRCQLSDEKTCQPQQNLIWHPMIVVLLAYGDLLSQCNLYYTAECHAGSAMIAILGKNKLWWISFKGNGNLNLLPALKAMFSVLCCLTHVQHMPSPSAIILPFLKYADCNCQQSCLFVAVDSSSNESSSIADESSISCPLMTTWSSWLVVGVLGVLLQLAGVDWGEWLDTSWGLCP